ncbi:hypothetical protein AB0H83_12245 [Dactylosporangium sp. NPDC050688]|uniref:hypothetical protein n=1 Tax=Dactylosporangium sp. NPDC050688 TaxID=3157217 RepID=UPI0033D77D82
MSTTVPARARATPAQLLLRRRSTVVLSTSDATPRLDGCTAPDISEMSDGPGGVAGVEVLEGRLAERGWQLSPALRAALLCLGTADLAATAARLLADCDQLAATGPRPPTGHDEAATTGPRPPAGHNDPAVTGSHPRPGRGEVPGRLRVLRLSSDPAAELTAELRALLGRPGLLPPGDAADLLVLLAAHPRHDLSWLPERIPARETKALVLAWLLEQPDETAVARVAAGVDTATDVLRILVVRSGGTGSLAHRPRLATVPRPLRRTLLSVLDRLPVEGLVDDMLRHRRAWVAAGEKLHPATYAGRYPNAAQAFAIVRATTAPHTTAGPDEVQVSLPRAAGADRIR